MHDMIQDGPPILNALSRNAHDDTLEASVPCTVDGYAAEFRIRLNTKEQRYSWYQIVMFHPVKMDWVEVVNWGMTEAGHFNTYPEPELLTALRSLGEIMWAYANVIVGQSNRRQEELEVQQYIATRVAYDEAFEAATLGDDATELVRESAPGPIFATSADSFETQVEALNEDR